MARGATTTNCARRASQHSACEDVEECTGEQRAETEWCELCRSGGEAASTEGHWSEESLLGSLSCFSRHNSSTLVSTISLTLITVEYTRGDCVLFVPVRSNPRFVTVLIVRGCLWY